MTVIQRELQRGCDITDNVMMSKRPWNDLFVKHTFFTSDYKHYIAVITTSTTKEGHKIWSGYVESKVRVLVQGLEQHPSIAVAHAFNKGYDRRHKCSSAHEINQVQEGCLDYLLPADESSIAESEGGNGSPRSLADGESQKATAGVTQAIVFTTTHYIGLELVEGE